MDVFASTKANSILDLVGETPIVKINKLNPNPSVEIYAKLEGLNPGGSVKDRITKKMVEEAERKGKLSKDKVILEPTSGNTGIGLAMVATAKGYNAVLVQPASVSAERTLMLKAFGADVVLTPPEKGTDGAIKKARSMAKENPEKYWMPDQFDNPANPKAHYEGTGPEIWKQTNGRVTHFVAGMGTSGTIMGAGSYLKEKNSEIEVIGVEPELGHKVQGLKNMKEAIIPEIYKREEVDRKLTINTQESYKWAYKVTQEEGIFVGQSSGTAMLASRKVAKELNEGLIVTVFPDFGFKYLTSKPYHDEKVIKKLEEAREEEKTIEI